MNRRNFIALSCLGIPGSALSETGRTYRIGYLSGGTRVPWIDAFLRGLRELGYVEGQNTSIEFQIANGQLELLPQMSETLVRHNVDVIVTSGNAAGKEVKQNTKTIPIVVLASHDGVGTGLFESMPHPGGNITGIESLAPSLDAKRIEIMKEVLPRLHRLTILYNPQFPGAKPHVESVKSAAAVLASDVALVEVESPADFDRAFQAIIRERPDALLPIADNLIFFASKRIVDFVVEQKIPSVFEFKQFVQIGGLISYGPSISEIWHRGAYYVDKILKGAKAGDIPVEQPTKFELAINLKAAKALGLTIPTLLLAIADEVIE